MALSHQSREDRDSATQQEDGFIDSRTKLRLWRADQRRRKKMEEMLLLGMAEQEAETWRQMGEDERQRVLQEELALHSLEVAFSTSCSQGGGAWSGINPEQRQQLANVIMVS